MAITCATYLACGAFSMAALGPALPELAARTGSNLSSVGAMFTGIFLGALVAPIVAGLIIDRVATALCCSSSSYRWVLEAPGSCWRGASMCSWPAPWCSGSVSAG